MLKESSYGSCFQYNLPVVAGIVHQASYSCTCSLKYRIPGVLHGKERKFPGPKSNSLKLD